MKGVKAVACDMNAGFSNAFTDRFPHIAIVFDRFHIIKHFNEDVIGEIRKDLEKELIKEGRTEEAKRLKKGRYILTAGRDTLAEKDRAAAEQKEAEERRAAELQKAQDKSNAVRQQAVAEASEATVTPGATSSDQQTDQPLQTAPGNAPEGTAAIDGTDADLLLDLQDEEHWQISTTEASEAVAVLNGATVADQKQPASRNRKSTLFKRKAKKIRGGNIALLEQLLKDNKLLNVSDVVKEKLKHAYELKGFIEMSKEIKEIIEICIATGNRHLIRFANMFNNHIDGILGRGIYQISSGRVEGFNNKIKTLRRKAYGYNDDDYFFLKIIDISYHGYS